LTVCCLSWLTETVVARGENQKGKFEEQF